MTGCDFCPLDPREFEEDRSPARHEKYDREYEDDEGKI